ncbi:MAG: hypothetical protein ACTS8R_01730 [Arsenophonus sp. NC-QC1-MAG3]
MLDFLEWKYISRGAAPTTLLGTQNSIGAKLLSKGIQPKIKVKLLCYNMRLAEKAAMSLIKFDDLLERFFSYVSFVAMKKLEKE